MGIRDIVVGLIASVVTAVALLVGISGGSDEQPRAGSPSGISIEDICDKPETLIRLVNTENGPQFQARYETSDIRYDLTWQPDGNVVAVEQLDGAVFVASVQQATPGFWACVERKGYEVISGSNH